MYEGGGGGWESALVYMYSGTSLLRTSEIRSPL